LAAPDGTGAPLQEIDFMFNAKFTSLLHPGEQVNAEQLEADRNMQAFGRSVNLLSRRRFAGGLTGAIALVVGGGFIESPKGFAQVAAGTGPAITDVLNFALNLEYLEANLYSIVTTGNPVSSSLMGTAPGTISGSPGKLTLATMTTAIFQALMNDEMNHINDLRQAITSLGGTPISMPNINYAAQGAITTEPQLYATTRQFTALGNSAYAGAAQYLVSNPAVLTVASQILAAEGQHLGVINFELNVSPNTQGAPSPAIDFQDNVPSATQFFNVFQAGAANSNTTNQAPSLAPARTTSQDLGVVYGVSTPTITTPPAGITSGGFFPAGVNGNIKST
jgi:hypothetical protein